MDYDIIKQLKEAKFPNEKNTYVFDWYLYGEPNLSQLIKACGKIKIEIDMRNDNIIVGYKDLKFENEIIEDSIAMLWLELDKKNKFVGDININKNKDEDEDMPEPLCGGM